MKDSHKALFDGFLLGDFDKVIRKKRRRRHGGDVGGGSELELSNNSTSDAALVGDLVGTFSVVGGVGSYIYSFLGNPGNLFAISGAELLVNASLSPGVDPIIVEADNGLGDVVAQLFSISVRHVNVGYVPTYELLGF